jgi:hypothetical protein
MKKFIYSFLLIAGINLILNSCSNEDNVRIPDTEEAANVRLQLNPDYSSLRADDIANAKIELSAFSENKNLNQVVISAQYYNFATDSLYSRRTVKVFTQTDFDQANGAIENIDFTSSMLAEIFGLSSADDLGGGDRFDFYNVTNLTNGLTFPDTIPIPGDIINVSPGVTNTSATTSFTSGFTVYVACPINPNFGTGNYMVEQIDGPDDPFFGNAYRWEPGEVTITSVSPIQRTFAGKYFTFDVNFSFLLICGKLLVGTTSSGVGCSSSLDWKSSSPPGTYDESDDGEFIIKLTDNINGDCGLPIEPLTLKLTKINN